MKKLLSILLTAVTLFAAYPNAAHAATKCASEKRVQKEAQKRDKKAEQEVAKQERLIASLERKIESLTRSVESAIASRDQAYNNAIERYKRVEDREENKRQDAIANAALLASQIAACAGADALNGLLGTGLDCGPAQRNQLLAASARATKEIATRQLNVDKARARGQRTAQSEYKKRDIKVVQQQKKLDRANADLVAANNRLPELKARAVQTQALFVAADNALNQCLSL